MSPVPDIVLTLLQTIHDDLQEVKTEQKKMGETLTEHIATEPEEWATVVDGIISRVCPGGDADGHRKAHEYAMKKAAERSEFWGKLSYELAKWGLIGFIGWAAVSLIQAAAHHLHNMEQVAK